MKSFITVKKKWSIDTLYVENLYKYLNNRTTIFIFSDITLHGIVFLIAVIQSVIFRADMSNNTSRKETRRYTFKNCIILIPLTE